MTIAGTYSAEDLVAAAWVHLRPRRSVGVLGIAIVALVVVAMSLAFLGYADDSFWARWVLPAILLYLAVAFGVGIPYKARRAFRQRKDLQRPISFSASDHGLSLATEGLSAVKPWSDYLKWKEGTSAFLLYISDNMYQVVPKRFFSSEGELRDFRELIGRKIARRVG